MTSVDRTRELLGRAVIRATKADPEEHPSDRLIAAIQQMNAETYNVPNADENLRAALDALQAPWANSGNVPQTIAAMTPTDLGALGSRLVMAYEAAIVQSELDRAARQT